MAVPHHFYRLPHRVDTGIRNMAADGALLAWVCEGTERLAFRTYAWERPTLSLGRSNPFPHGWDEGALARAGIDVARRPTGGDAVLHVEEVTFALAASLPGPWNLTPRGFASAAAQALAGALESCGLTGARLEERRVPTTGSTLCFARSAPGEVLAGGFKVAGLASRFDRRGALCHASVPLTARSRSIARFRLGAEGESEALERNARSVGELLGQERVEALAVSVGEGLAERIAARFGVALRTVPFEAVGIEACEPASLR